MRRALCVISVAFALNCQSPAPTPEAPVLAAERPAGTLAPSTARPTIAIATDDAARDGRLVIELPDPRLAPGTATIEPLPADAVTALTARMEPPPVIDNTHAPPLRAPTVAPPRGDTQPIAFVVTAGKPTADLPPGSAPPAPPPTKPLARPQISPQDDVGHEATVRVRFDEVMIPVAQVGAAAAPPVTLAPAVPGVWRWLDTRVLEFAPTAARLPQATEVTVTVPA